MRKRVLLTGATGFVGKQVLSCLLQADVDVRLLVRHGSAPKLKHAVQDMVLTEDLFRQDRSWWREVFQDIHTVIHTAWYAVPGDYLQSPKNLDCLRGTLEMAAGAVDAGVKRFVGIGSCAEYDLTEGYLSVQTALKPTTVYGGAKAATYLGLSNYFAQCGVEFAWCRLFYLYGEDEDPRRLVPYLHRQLSSGQTAELSSGEQIRDYLDVATAGAEITEIALGTGAGPKNVCSGTATSIKQLSEKIADVYGRRDLLRFGQRTNQHFDPPCIVGLKE